MRRLRPDHWLEDHGGSTLVVFGVVLLALALLVADDTAMAVALVVLGPAAVVLGIVLPRVEGRLRIGPGGLDVLLGKVVKKAEEAHLPEQGKDRAVDHARELYELWREFGSAVTRERAAEEIAQEVVRTSTVSCANCGTILDERTDIPAEEREKCPTCGSTARAFAVTGGGGTGSRIVKRSE